MCRTKKERFEELVSSYFPYLIKLFQRSGFPQEAEDWAQEVFLRVWRFFCRGGQCGSSPQRWLRRIAKSVISDKLRKECGRGKNDQEDSSPGVKEERERIDSIRRRRKGVGIDHIDPPEDQFPGPHEQLEKIEVNQKLAEAIRRLPYDLREVVALRYSGCSHEEIGQRLGFGERTSKWRWYKARNQLREVLASCQ